MNSRFRIAGHGLEICLTAPLGIVGYPGSIQALVDIGREVARLVPHRALGCFDEEIDQALLVCRGNREDSDQGDQAFLCGNGGQGFSSPFARDRSTFCLKDSRVV